MPTKKELEDQIIKLQIENDDLLNRWLQADKMCLELIDKLTLKNTQLKVTESALSRNWIEECAAHKLMADSVMEELNQGQNDIDDANESIERKNQGVKNRTENALKKYHKILPFYVEGLIAGKSRRQAARNAHIKARKIDDTIPETISDRQLTRELNKLVKEKYIILN